MALALVNGQPIAPANRVHFFPSAMKALSWSTQKRRIVAPFARFLDMLCDASANSPHPSGCPEPMLACIVEKPALPLK